MRVKKYFCKCGRRIKKKEIPYCQNCLLAEYNRLKRSAKTKSNKNMITNQITEEEEFPRETPEEESEKEEEETTDEDEK